jgi:beta-lactam-binding protein with PASTA domain
MHTKILVGKSKRKISLGRIRFRSVDHIRTDLRETGWKVVDWSYLAQDRDLGRALVNTVMNLRVL